MKHLSHTSHVSTIDLSYAMDSTRFLHLRVVKRIYMVNTGIHYYAEKWILLVLLGMKDVGICFRGCSSHSMAVIGYMNPGHTGNLKDGIFLSSYAFASISGAVL